MARKILQILLLMVFLVGAAIAGYNIYAITSEYHAGESTYGQMQQYIQLPANADGSSAESISPSNVAEATVSTETTSATAPTHDPIDYPKVDFNSLQKVNDDVVAWIYIEDTKINYPVLQGKDNREYVSTMIDGRYNGAGSIFMDYHNSADMTDRHTILYGHNMQNGTMFAGISNYRNQEYYDAHPIGLLMTPEKNYYFEIVAAYVASLADPAWQLEFVDDQDTLEWLEATMDRSSFTSRIQPQPGDQIITLSTCSYEYNDARFVLVGVLRED